MDCFHSRSLAFAVKCFSGEGGIRTTRNSRVKTALSRQGGAKSGARTETTVPHAPELLALIEAWPRLPDALKAGILAMIRSATA
jgi:hypothetical protein